MRTLPGMTVLDPADATEIEQAVWAVADHPGPVYSRMMRREVRRLFDPGRYRFRLGKGVPLRIGGEVLLVTTGLVLEMALEAAKALDREGIAASILHLPTVKPLDDECLLDLARDTGAVVTVENHLVTGGLGSAVAEVLGEHLPLPLERIGLRDAFALPGSPEFLFRRYGISPAAIVEGAKRALARRGRR